MAAQESDTIARVLGVQLNTLATIFNCREHVDL